jgi:DHA1 family bicyclomycin/chloramphenicol resistance-like MFS transporter
MVRFVIILGSLSAFAPLAIDMYLPAFPAIEAQFDASAAAVQATLAIFFVGLACGQALYGPLADRYGRRVPLLVGVALFAVASILVAWAPGMTSFGIARLLQALGGCAGMVIARAMVSDLFAERDAAKVFSFLMLVMGVAPILAPLAGGQLLAAFGWSSIFWFLGGFGLCCLAAVTFGLGETLPPQRRSRGGVGDALRAYVRLLGDRSFVGFAAGGSLAMAGMFAYITSSPFVFIQLHGVSPQRYGLLFGLNALGLIAASQINVRLLRRFSGQAILSAAVVAAMAAGFALAAVAIAGIGGLIGLMIPLFVVVATIGFTLPNSIAAAMARARGHGGAASALIGVMQFGLAALAGSLVGALHARSAVPMAVVIAGLGLAAFLVVRLAGGGRRREREAAASGCRE